MHADDAQDVPQRRSTLVRHLALGLLNGFLGFAVVFVRFATSRPMLPDGTDPGPPLAAVVLPWLVGALCFATVFVCRRYWYALAAAVGIVQFVLLLAWVAG